MTLFCYKPSTLAKEKRNWELQNTRSSTGGSRKFFRNSKAQDAPVELPGSPREGEGADGMTLKRASRGNKHRNWRKTLGPRRKNFLDPLGSLFTMNKGKNQ